ncbi:autotransporter-associated beta strand repeat-containing protein [Methylobacterium sp. E-005]|uniref:autotransporter-associated beta strand repeat-containing protein n=1 Tax=Methylobacterium sp. E-005 TaxID=2836549 RepID=UPI001FBA9003|nr:autotransporter-associated beta strand repeat-containing protein [Methylobacterium sp. E-005]MCJ2089588.1 autotransporter-associated beta strand repeat-containing protein [Methylobacterium sp. E-005]
MADRALTGRNLRRALAASTALVSAAVLMVPMGWFGLIGSSGPASANGGNGGKPENGSAGGAGGTGYAGAFNGNQNGSNESGGGGGSAGGGAGGQGGADVGTDGGAGGTGSGIGASGLDGAAGGNGMPPSEWFYPDGGGGGGGQGGFNAYVNTTLTNAGTLTGGTGGAGGTSYSGIGGGGGGGAGGYGAVVTGSGASVAAPLTGSNSGAILGGTGGAGGLSGAGRGSFQGGNGGDGGIGAFFAGDYTTFTNLTVGTLTGGAGGVGGAGTYLTGGAGGAGGAGASFAGSGASLTNNATITGGNGGVAGSGAGGGGLVNIVSGVGGTGVSFAGAGAILINLTGASITGGNGGNSNSSNGRAGGTGGAGVSFASTGNTLINNAGGTITGGTGGTGDSSRSNPAGAGGAGVSGSGLTITNAGAIQGGSGGATGSGTAAIGGIGVIGATLSIINAGTIAGGLPGSGTAANRANAVTFTGGASSLELQAATAGGLYAGITGAVVVQTANGASGTLLLGGANAKTFDVSAIGAVGSAAQYQGFSAFIKTGTVTWTLTGTTTAITPWTINQGTLTVSQNGNLGATSGGLTFGGGTLEILAGPAPFTSARGIALNAAGTVQVDTAANTATLSGIIADSANGSGHLTKTGAGTLVLSGTNSYTGGTVITVGTLSAANPAALGTGGATVASGATLDVNGVTIANSLTLSGTGAGDAGALTGTSTAGVSGAVTLGANAAIGGTGRLTISGAIGDSGNGFGLTKVGAGTLVLSAANTYSGGTTVSAGTLQLNHQTGGTIDAGGTGTITVGDAGLAFAQTGTLANQLTLNGTIASRIGAAAGTTTTLTGGFDAQRAPRVVFGSSSDTGTIVLSPGGTASAARSQTYEIAGGTLRAGDTTLGGIFLGLVGTQIDAGGTLDLNGFTSAIRNLQGDTATTGGVLTNAAGTTTTIGGGSFAGQINGAGDVVFNAASSGLFGIAPTTGTTTLSGVNGYTGATTIYTGATLNLSGAGSIAQSSGVANDGTFDISATTNGTSITTLSGSGGTSLGAKTLTITNGSTSYGGVMSGSGGLTVSGGTQTLTGANTYTGATTITAGTLALSGIGLISASGTVALGTGATFDISGHTGGTAIAGLSNTGANQTGTVALGANTLTLTAAAGSFGGTISGAGGLQLTGGTQMLTGANTYGGGTTIATGASLQLGSGAGGGTSGSIIGDVANDGTLTLNRSNAMTFAGAISGAGSLVQTGSGTTTLTGTNRYQGGTAIDGGTLQVAADTNLGDAAGALAFGGGTLATTASFATSRSTTLSVGGGTFAPGATTTLTQAGVISGTGPLTVAGVGTLALTGANTYAGATTISAGATLQLGTGGSTGSIDATAAITNNGALIANRAGTLTLAAPISGTGVFTQAGPGTTILTARNTYTGATTVDAGTLQVDGVLTASDVTVNLGGRLSGSGKIGDPLINAGGTLAPGSATSIGTLSITGPLTFAPGSFYQVKVTPTTNDRTAVTGTTTIQGGTVQILAGSGTYTPALRYTLLSASGGVIGTFTNLQTTSNLAFLTPSLSYDRNNVYLGFAQTAAVTTVASTGNQTGTATALNGAGPTVTTTTTASPTPATTTSVAANGTVTTTMTNSGGTTTVVSTPAAQVATAVLNQTAPGAVQALNSLSGEVQASAITAQVQTAFLVQEAILDHLRFGESNGFAGPDLGGPGLTGTIGQRFAPGTTLPAMYSADVAGDQAVGLLSVRPVTPNYALWGQGFGSFGNTASNGNAAHLTRQTGGFVLGGETGFGVLSDGLFDDLRVGVAAGYTFTSFDVTSRQSTGNVESGFGAVYGRASLRAIQIRAGAAYAGNALDTRRTVLFPGFSQADTGKAGGDTVNGFGEVGYRIGFAQGYVEPFAGGAAIHIRRDRFAETGGASALTVFGRSYDVETATAGLQGQAVLSDLFGTATPIIARGLLGYRRAFGDVVPQALLAFGGGEQAFLTAGVPIARDALVASAGLDVQVAANVTLGLNYTGQVGARAQDHAVKGAFNYRW